MKVQLTLSNIDNSLKRQNVFSAELMNMDTGVVEINSKNDMKKLFSRFIKKIRGTQNTAGHLFGYLKLKAVLHYTKEGESEHYALEHSLVSFMALNRVQINETGEDIFNALLWREAEATL